MIKTGFLPVIALVLAFSLMACNTQPTEVLTSPDGTISVAIWHKRGTIRYEVRMDDQTIVSPSATGFRLKDGSTIGKNSRILSVERSETRETWFHAYGYSEGIQNHFNEMIMGLYDRDSDLSYSIIARAYDDGVAFRYFFPKAQNPDSLLITHELTGFVFPEDFMAWWIPADEFALESLYRHTPVSEISNANTPITLYRGDSLYFSIHEAALVNFSEMYLQSTGDHTVGFCAGLWPDPDGISARIGLPFTTPWRTITLGRSAADLVESHIILNLNEPARIEDTSWIRPIKFVGIWWGLHTGAYTWYEGPQHGATTQRTKQYIDFAARNGIEGVLAEGWNKGWETWATQSKNIQDFVTPYDSFDLEEIVSYARSRNVVFVSHHETGSNIPDYEQQLDTAFAQLQHFGIHALKTGYAGQVTPAGYHPRGQYMIRHFQKVVETAARHQVALNVHEGPKPTGLERTWPNLLTTEAIRGNEWNATYRATPPSHTTILPFTRFLAGPADYTPGIFNINHSPGTNRRLYCTLAHQLSMYVLFYSPMKMVADQIEHYENHPAFQFIREVPSVWDETRVLAARPGSYVSMARRTKQSWFVGSAANEETHLIKISLDFLDPDIEYVATLYGDDITTDWEHNPTITEIVSFKANATDTLWMALSKAGGNAIAIHPAYTARDLPSTTLARYNSKAEEKHMAFKLLNTFGLQTIQHAARGKKVTLTYPYNDLYPASGEGSLTNGIKGSLLFDDGAWQGFRGNNLEAVVDLGELTEVSHISAGFLSSPNDWIFLPSKVEFWTSEDGNTFQKAGEVSLVAESKQELMHVKVQNVHLDFPAIRARWVKVVAHNTGICPPWHYAGGEKAWLFADEIIIQ